jgi:hypothetical protein
MGKMEEKNQSTGETAAVTKEVIMVSPISPCNVQVNSDHWAS